MIEGQVWGSDWTEKFNPGDKFVPGTLLLDPFKKRGSNELTREDILTVTRRQPLAVDDNDYQALSEKLGLFDNQLVCFIFAQLAIAHNEGTKFGTRRVAIVTPVIVNKERFKTHENLIPYFVYEQNLLMAQSLPHAFTVNGLSKELLAISSQQAKTQSMKYALFNGDLPTYLTFHDMVYPANSVNEAVLAQNAMKTVALQEIERECTPASFKLWSSVKTARRNPPDIFKVWQKQMQRKGYSFDYLNERIK